jgi:hypothetical protein
MSASPPKADIGICLNDETPRCSTADGATGCCDHLVGGGKTAKALDSTQSEYPQLFDDTIAVGPALMMRT